MSLFFLCCYLSLTLELFLFTFLQTLRKNVYSTEKKSLFKKCIIGEQNKFVINWLILLKITICRQFFSDYITDYAFFWLWLCFSFLQLFVVWSKRLLFTFVYPIAVFLCSFNWSDYDSFITNYSLTFCLKQNISEKNSS